MRWKHVCKWGLNLNGEYFLKRDNVHKNIETKTWLCQNFSKVPHYEKHWMSNFTDSFVSIQGTKAKLTESITEVFIIAAIWKV